MKTTLTFLMVLLSAFNCTAQQQKIDSLKKALLVKTKDTNSVWTLNKLYVAYVNVESDSALAYATQALEVSKEIKWGKGICMSYKGIGHTYYIKGDYAKAIDFFRKGIEKGEEINESFLVATLYMNIAIVYKDLKRYDLSLSQLTKSLALIKKFNNKKQEAIIYYNMANIYLIKKKIDKSLSYFRTVVKIGEQLKDQQLLGNAYTAISAVYEEKKDYPSGIKYAEKAIPYAVATGDLALHGLITNNLSLLYLYRKNYEKCLAYNNEALEIAIKTKNNPFRASVYSRRSQIYLEMKDYKNALTAFSKYDKLKDTLTGEQKNIEIATQELKYEADKKQAIANAEIKNQKTLRNYGYAGGAMLLLVGILVFYLYKKHRDAIQKQKELLYKAKVSDTEMQILRLQMNPHFIFNSLNSISDYIGKNDIKTADYYLSKFAKLMRGILENSEEKEIPLANELKMLELYMQLEASRLKSKFSYEFKIDGDIDIENTFVPPLILQPFVENSIWHGLANKEDGGKIIIQVTRDNTMLNCIIEDNGLGRAQAKKSDRKSYGMKITHDRIALLNKLKNTNASVNLIDLEKGTRAEIKLPFETE